MVANSLLGVDNRDLINTLSGPFISPSSMNSNLGSVTFTVPNSGKVKAIARLVLRHGGTSAVAFLIGILEGTKVVARKAAMAGPLFATQAANAMAGIEVDFTITGLTPGASLTWQVAFSGETGTDLNTKLQKQGLDDAIADNAAGNNSLEIWGIN